MISRALFIAVWGPGSQLFVVTLRARPTHHESTLPTQQANKPRQQAKSTSQASKQSQQAKAASQVNKPSQLAKAASQDSKPSQQAKPASQASKPRQKAKSTNQASKPSQRGRRRNCPRQSRLAARASGAGRLDLESLRFFGGD